MVSVNVSVIHLILGMIAQSKTVLLMIMKMIRTGNESAVVMVGVRWNIQFQDASVSDVI